VYKPVTKIGNEHVPYICALIMCVNEFTTTTTASMHVWLVCGFLCVAWLNDGLAWCEYWSGVKLQWITLLVCSHSSSSSLCVCGPTAGHSHSHAC